MSFVRVKQDIKITTEVLEFLILVKAKSFLVKLINALLMLIVVARI